MRKSMTPLTAFRPDIELQYYDLSSVLFKPSDLKLCEHLQQGHEQQTDGSQIAYQQPQHVHTHLQSQLSDPQQTGPPPLQRPFQADSTQVPAAPVDVSNDMRLAPTVLYEKASRAIRQRHPSESTDPLQ